MRDLASVLLIIAAIATGGCGAAETTARVRCGVAMGLAGIQVKQDIKELRSATDIEMTKKLGEVESRGLSSHVSNACEEYRVYLKTKYGSRFEQLKQK